MEIKAFTKQCIPDVLDFERRLRQEEDFWNWEIDDAYIQSVARSFDDPKFRPALSLLAYADGKVVGRIDACLVYTHFDGSVKAYLDWICVLKSARHLGVAQALIGQLRRRLREEYGVDTLIALMARNEEAQRFYRSLENAEIHDEGIWIGC